MELTSPGNNRVLKRVKSPELWGGVECTVNRTGDVYHDQLRLTGHDDRIADLDRIGALEIVALRQPVLWERVSPDRPDLQDWDWSDRWLARLRELRIRPIVGLVHHGSGPRYTSLLDTGFAQGLAAHALAVARRYPWIEGWTPVNEPLTTARFAALYGHWHPHAQDERAFWNVLLNEIDGVRLSMRAVRSVNPAARLVQTDDLGRTYATACLADQAAYNNVRRWMGWDLLCGRVAPGHDFWGRLCGYDLEDRLRAILDDPCPPDVIGINHYATSDRFLDHRVQHYPETQAGGAPPPYADVTALRVLKPPPQGLGGALTEAWSRYGLPLAVTEVHIGCTRDEQVRWLRESWNTAEELLLKGVDVRAVTAWALFGSQGWNTVLTDKGDYEPGAFDIRDKAPRATAIAQAVKDLSGGTSLLSPAVRPEGWWRRDIRLLHPPVSRPARMREHAPAGDHEDLLRDPILILGATGTLGQAIAAACRHRNLAYKLIGRAELDLTRGASIAAALAAHRPSAVINTAGWVRVDEAEDEREACLGVNAAGAVALAWACQEKNIPTVNFSSDLVFDGAAGHPYLETDAPAPLNVYGESKLCMELEIGSFGGRHLIARTAAFFSPWDRHNFAFDMVRTLRAGERFVAVDDCVVSPTYVPDLCDAVLDLLIDGATGFWHLSNAEPVSWFGFAQRLAHACDLDPQQIDAIGSDAAGWRAARPPYSALASERGALLPSLDAAIGRFAEVAKAKVNAVV